MALPSRDRVLEDLLTRSGSFEHIQKFDDFFWVANGINALTALCSPTLRRRDGQVRVEYDLLLIVVDKSDEKVASLQSAIMSRRYVGLPKTFDPRRTLDTFVVDGAMTDWLTAEMRSDMSRYTMGRDSALSMICSGTDPFIAKLKRVFGEGFEQDIERPLQTLA